MAISDSMAPTPDEYQAALGPAFKRLERRMQGSWRDGVYEVEALIQLYSGHTPRAMMPPSNRWAMDPTALLHLSSLVSDMPPPVYVLELGSGTSTIWLGYIVEKLGGTLVSIEHDERYLELSRREIALHKLGSAVDLRHAPLIETRIDGAVYYWYDEDFISDISDIDVLVIDGPPQSTGKHARYPALPKLKHKLSQGAIICLDDSPRLEETEVLRMWEEDHPDLELVDHIRSRLGILVWSH